MKLPIKLLAFAMFLFVMVTASCEKASAADSDRVASVQADTSSTVKATSVDGNIVTAECPIAVPRARESVGKTILNVRIENFEPVTELAGYRTVLERPKIDTYSGYANTRAREQV